MNVYSPDVKSKWFKFISYFSSLRMSAITHLLYVHHQSRGEVQQKVWMWLICSSGHPCSLLLWCSQGSAQGSLSPWGEQDPHPLPRWQTSAALKILSPPLLILICNGGTTQQWHYAMEMYKRFLKQSSQDPEKVPLRACRYFPYTERHHGAPT